MEIKNVLSGLGQYDKARLEKSSDVQKGKKESNVAEVKQGDRANISDEGLLRAEAHKSASGAPDVRKDKVAELKAKIAAGEYEMDSRKIAEKMVRDDLDLLGV